MGDQVLRGEGPCKMTPSQAGRAIAKKLGRERPYSAQTVRNWIREGSGFPAVLSNPGDPRCNTYHITDIAAAAEWVRINKPDNGQGGSRDGAGRKPSRPAVDTSAGVDEFDDSPGGDETTPSGEGNGYKGTAAETKPSAARTVKTEHEAGIAKLKHEQMLGQLIDRDDASEGYSRVYGPLVRRLDRVPGRVVDRAADRMNLTSEARTILMGILVEEIEQTRTEIAGDPFGLKLDNEDAAA